MAVKGRHALALALSLGCNAPTPPPPTGGADLDEGPCGYGLYVVTSDYQSTSVAIVDWAGVVHSARVVGSSSADVGLGTALSGDVVAPTSRVQSGRIVLIDRGAGALTFVDPRRGEVDLQRSVTTGFAANPQDYLEIDADTAYVARYEANPSPGAEPFDAGSDLLVLAGAQAEIVARIDLGPAMTGAEEGLLPRPSRMLRVGEHVVVLLSVYGRGFGTSGDARLAVIDPSTHEIVSSLALPGARGCSALAAAPSGERLAVGCSGTFALSSTPSLEDAGVVLVDVGGGGSLSEAARFPALPLLEDPPGFTIAFADERTVLVPTFGRLALDGTAERDDRLLALDVEAGTVRELLRSEVEPFTLGEVRCDDACGACFVTDADRGRVVRYAIGPDGPAAPRSIELDDGIGLPPRGIGAY